MSTFTQSLHQIVFSTYLREQTLTDQNRPELYRYITGLLKNKNCHPYQIGGTADHLHIITDLHPAEDIASLVKAIKIASSKHIKLNRLFPHFKGWQEGYAAFTYSIKDKQKLINYVKNQELHHKEISFKEELIELLNEHAIQIEEKYLL